MPLDYIGSNTGIFDRGGKLVKYVDAHLANATTTLPAELKAIADKFELADMTDQVTGLYDNYETMRRQEVNNRGTIAGYWDRILLDKASVLDQLRVEADIDTVLTELFRQMGIDGQTVDQSTVTIGAISAASGNVGNGTVLLTKRLDGFNAPVSDGLVILGYAGLNSELACTTETMTFTCTSDSYRDGVTPGGESFAWTGHPQDSDGLFGYRQEVSGAGPTLTVAESNNIVTDGNFENWGGTGDNTPTSWDLTTGAAGTNFFRELVEVYRGTYALRITGDGSTTPRLDQTIATQLRSRRLYSLSLRMKRSAGATTGNIRISLTGTGYAAGSDIISTTVAALATTYTLYSAFILTPASIPADMTIHIANFSAALNAGESVYIDSLALVPVEYHGGIGAVVVPGSTPFVVGDRFTSAITNDDAGTFQRFFRKHYRMQLPSNGGGAETINDSLAL